jgi:hypothetical protein
MSTQEEGKADCIEARSHKRVMSKISPKAMHIALEFLLLLRLRFIQEEIALEANDFISILFC